MYAISACLCGVNCKYNGGNNYSEKVNELFQRGEAVLICPEQLGGLPTPRFPAEIEKGGTARDVIEGRSRIINIKGEDVTEFFLKGAFESLKIAKSSGCTKAILKSKSPSCGCGKVYDGTFSSTLVDGNGITAQLFLDNGIDVVTENDVEIR